MQINRIHHISFKWGVPFSDFEAADYRANADSTGAKNTLSIYESIDEDGEVEIKFWSFEKPGKRECFDEGASFFNNIEDFRKTFSGNPTISKLIACMGWMCWEDEIEVPSHQAMLETIGESYAGELNVSKLKAALKKYDGENVVVFRTVYEGSADVEFQQVLAHPLFTPEEFEARDDLEAARMVYQARKA